MARAKNTQYAAIKSVIRAAGQKYAIRNEGIKWLIRVAGAKYAIRDAVKKRNT